MHQSLEHFFRKKRSHSLLDRLGIHIIAEPIPETTNENSPTPPQEPLPPRLYMSLRVILPHGVNIYATPNSDPRLSGDISFFLLIYGRLLKLKKLNCGDIIPVHRLRYTSTLL